MKEAKEKIKRYLKLSEDKLHWVDEMFKRDLKEVPYFIYYSFFYLMHALLLTKEKEIKKLPSSHGGLAKIFGMYFPEFRDFTKYIYLSYELRHKTTYKLIDISEEEKEKLVELYNKALEFYERVVKYLKEKDYLEEDF